MTITEAEVRALGDRFFQTVADGGNAADQAAFFVFPESRIYVMEGGETIGFEQHQRLHRQWTNERHIFGDFKLQASRLDMELGHKARDFRDKIVLHQVLRADIDRDNGPAGFVAFAPKCELTAG